MNFELDTEQDMLRATVRDLLSGAYDVESRNRVAEGDLGWNRDVWKQLGELGVLGLGQRNTPHEDYCPMSIGVERPPPRLHSLKKNREAATD